MKGLLKILIGASVTGILLYKLPVLEIATAFFYAFFIPMVFLSAIGLVGSGTIDIVGGTFNAFGDQLRERVKAHRDSLAAIVPPVPTPVPAPVAATPVSAPVAVTPVVGPLVSAPVAVAPVAVPAPAVVAEVPVPEAIPAITPTPVSEPVTEGA